MSQHQQQPSNGTDNANLSEISPEGHHDETNEGYKLGDSHRLVPVTEAIKYRKRAQAAEQQVEELTRQLSRHEQEQSSAQGRLKEALEEKDLTHALVRAGVTDLEAALLLAQKKLKAADGTEQDMNGLIGSLRSERPYLFSNAVEEVAATLAVPTAGARTQSHGSSGTLLRLAEQARQSNDRKDMQEYLRLRRSVRR